RCCSPSRGRWPGPRRSQTTRPRSENRTMSNRAAIYTTFSSDRQNERSCDDQDALCTAWAERQGLSVTASYQDAAISGASTINRFGLASLMRDARAGRFDVVLCEALDRLSRDQADLARIKKGLAFLGLGL